MVHDAFIFGSLSSGPYDAFASDAVASAFDSIALPIALTCSLALIFSVHLARKPFDLVPRAFGTSRGLTIVPGAGAALIDASSTDVALRALCFDSPIRVVVQCEDQRVPQLFQVIREC